MNAAVEWPKSSCTSRGESPWARRRLTVLCLRSWNRTLAGRFEDFVEQHRMATNRRGGETVFLFLAVVLSNPVWPVAVSGIRLRAASRGPVGFVRTRRLQIPRPPR